MRRRVIGIAVGLLLVLGGILVIAHRKARLAEVGPPAQVALAVKTAPAVYGTFPATQRFLGTLLAKEAADLAPRLAGHLVEVGVREGAAVGKGDLLAILDDRQERDKVAQLGADLAAARTALATQEAIFHRDRSLFEAKAISQEALDHSLTARDSAKARLTSLEKALHSAETDLSYTRIAAPFEGVVTARLADPGDLAVPGKPVLAMEAPESGYFVSVKVPQDLFPELEVGGQAALSGGPDSDGRVSTTISRIHPAVREGILATAEIDTMTRPFGLPTGATINVDLVTGRYQGWRVPVGALLENTGAVYVFRVAEDATIHVEPVSLLSAGPEWAVVRAAIPDHARVVVARESALLRLHEGEKVRIAE